jgi:hypothetical protein
MTESEHLPIHFPDPNSTGHTFDVELANLLRTADLIQFHGTAVRLTSGFSELVSFAFSETHRADANSHPTEIYAWSSL